MATIANGTYKAKAIDAKLGESSNGNPQVGVLFEITQEGESNGLRIPWYGSFSDAKCGDETVADRTLRSLEYCGWGGDMSDLSGVVESGNEVSIVVEAETYQGKTRAKVQWVNAGGATAVAMKSTMADDKRLSFIDRMNARMAGKRAGRGDDSHSAGPVSVDDIPF